MRHGPKCWSISTRCSASLHEPPSLKCPSCAVELGRGFIYVRGFAGSLFWSETRETRFYSRKGLEQIDLSKISEVPTGGQAIIPAWRCSACGMVTFKSGSV